MTLEQRVEKLEKVIAKMKTGGKSQWVKASVITEKTGWNKEGMRAARKNCYIRYKKEGNAFFYDLNSLNPFFIK